LHADSVLALAPTYPGYLKATKMVHAAYRALPARAGGYDGDEWVQAVPTARVVWCCTPNNPTGAVLKHDDALRIVRVLPSGSVAVFDETYRDFCTDPNAANGMELVQAGMPAIVVRTFSKLYGLAGARVGYAVTHPDLAAAMLEHLDAFPVNRFGQAAAVAALSDAEHQAATRAYVLAGRAQLEDGLRRLNVEFIPSQANFVTANFGAACDGVVQTLQGAGYLVRAMDGPWGLPGWVRITVGLEAHNTAVLRAIEAYRHSRDGGVGD
jgi:histidinol-phosphate aminotransferase